MTTSSFLSLPLSSPLPSPIKKKRVLLVDASPVSRDLRAEAMRKLGMDVDCACDIGEARSWWRADLYNLVLINMENELGNRDKFCEDVRGATPPQQLAFLVGKPGLLADSPAEAVSGGSNGDSILPDEVSMALPAALSADQPLRWGIMAASKRISEVRSVFAARSKAMRNRPTPPRDLEVRDSKRPAFDPFLIGLQKEEMQ
jgi:CheY-like chemotaxis protein